MRPIMNIFSPVSGWNADSYIFLALHTCSSVVPTGSFLCLLVKKKNNHTATVEYTSSKCNSSPQTLTSLLLPGGLFLKSPGTSLGLESCFMFSMFTSKINILIDLKMIKQNY